MHHALDLAIAKADDDSRRLQDAFDGGEAEAVIGVFEREFIKYDPLFFLLFFFFSFLRALFVVCLFVVHTLSHDRIS